MTAKRIGHVAEIYHNKHVDRISLVLKVDKSSTETTAQLAEWLRQPLLIKRTERGILLTRGTE